MVLETGLQGSVRWLRRYHDSDTQSSVSCIMCIAWGSQGIRTAPVTMATIGRGILAGRQPSTPQRPRCDNNQADRFTERGFVRNG